MVLLPLQLFAVEVDQQVLVDVLGKKNQAFFYLAAGFAVKIPQAEQGL